MNMIKNKVDLKEIRIVVPKGILYLDENFEAFGINLYINVFKLIVC